MKKHWSSFIVLCAWYAVLSDPASSQPSAGFRVSATGSSSSLTAEIETAAADSLYAVEMNIAPRTSVGELRAVAAELDVPRVLAVVEYAVGDEPAQRGLFMLALGRLYDGNASQHSECQALLQLRSTANALGEVPIDEWPVGRIHLSATAHTVRDLLRGIRLAGAAIISGSAAPPDHLRTLERAVRAQTSQPIPNPGDIDLPPYCAQFVVGGNEPYLTGGFPRGFQPPTATLGELFRETAFRVLAALPPNMAVTIDLKLNPRMEIDGLAALVRDYRVGGMRAGLVPERSIQRMESLAELSTFGGDLSVHVRRVQCAIRMTEERGHASGAWRSDWINISLSAEDAARFLSHQSLAQATVSGAQPITALDQLAAYYERLVAQVYEIPRSWPIPSGCENVYVHGDYDDEGSVRSVGGTA